MEKKIKKIVEEIAVINGLTKLEALEIFKLHIRLKIINKPELEENEILMEIIQDFKNLLEEKNG